MGVTERALQEQGVDYVAGRASYRQNARGEIIGDQDGFLKLLFRKGDGRLLGVIPLERLVERVAGRLSSSH